MRGSLSNSLVSHKTSIKDIQLHFAISTSDYPHEGSRTARFGGAW